MTAATVAAPSLAPPWLGRRSARVLLAVLLGLLGWGLAVAAQPSGPAPARASEGEYSDVDLYREMATGVAGGAPYYPTAVTAAHTHGYATAPPVAIRLPTLTWLQAALGETGATVLLTGLGVAALVAVLVRLDRAGIGVVERTAALLLLGANLALSALGPVAWFHEAWAGTLLLLALALHTDRRWWPSVLLGLAAVGIRELALPFLLVMAVLAWPRRREVLAWLGAVAVSTAGYVAHWTAVLAAQPAVPALYPNAFRFGGWSFILGTVGTGSVLAAAPLAVTAVAVPLALFGWLFAGSWRRPVAVTLATFTGAFLVVGRPDNVYWGLLYAPLLLTGAAFCVRGLVTTVRAASGRPPG